MGISGENTLTFLDVKSIVFSAIGNRNRTDNRGEDMETNIFTTVVYWLCGFAAVLSVVVLLIPHSKRFDNILLFNKKVGPKYWGRYEESSATLCVGTIEVHEPNRHEETITFGSRAYSSGSTGV